MSELWCTVKPMTIDEYRKDKMLMLVRDFKVGLKQAEIDHLMELKTEISIDQYVRTILKSRWD